MTLKGLLLLYFHSIFLKRGQWVGQGAQGTILESKVVI